MAFFSWRKTSAAGLAFPEEYKNVSGIKFLVCEFCFLAVLCGIDELNKHTHTHTITDIIRYQEGSTTLFMEK